MNKDLEQRYLNLIEDNVNVGITNDGIEFLILIGGIIGICFLIFIFADTIAGIFIDRMPDTTQIKIERAISFASKPKVTENNPDIEKLDNLKRQIIARDKTLQNKSEFKIFEVPNKEVNAFIVPDGTIFVTEGLLSQVKDKEVLTFVLAHELGHYAHRDHLKTISRQIIASVLMSLLQSGQNNVNIAIGGISDISGLKYSRNQEKNADKYANIMVYKIYGRNTGAVKFFQYLEKKENAPEFLQYFSTHPSTKQRLELIKR